MYLLSQQPHSTSLHDRRFVAQWEAQPHLLTPLQATSSEAGASIADQVFPYFIVETLPPGVGGLIIAAIVSDVLRKPDSDAKSMRHLYSATLGMGVLGTAVAIAMIGVESVLDAWWTLSGIFAGGLLGLFLLGLAVRRARRTEAAIAAVVGVLVILWMTAGPRIPAPSESPFHSNMITVVGTTTIFLVGALLSRRRP